MPAKHEYEDRLQSTAMMSLPRNSMVYIDLTHGEGLWFGADVTFISLKAAVEANLIEMATHIRYITARHFIIVLLVRCPISSLFALS